MRRWQDDGSCCPCPCRRQFPHTADENVRRSAFRSANGTGANLDWFAPILRRTDPRPSDPRHRLCLTHDPLGRGIPPSSADLPVAQALREPHHDQRMPHPWHGRGADAGVIPVGAERGGITRCGHDRSPDHDAIKVSRCHPLLAKSDIRCAVKHHASRPPSVIVSTPEKGPPPRLLVSIGLPPFPDTGHRLCWERAANGSEIRTVVE